MTEPGLSDEVIRRKKCVKFFDPRHSDASINNPFVYEPNYMGCHENFCESIEECKKGDLLKDCHENFWKSVEGCKKEDLSNEQKSTRKTVPKR